MCATLRGWLLDLYEDAVDGVRLWVISEEGERLCLHQPMPITFFAAGEAEQLRALWKMLRRQEGVVSLSRELRRDVFLPESIPVLQAVIDNPIRQARLFREVQRQFPHLTYYDSDIAVTTRHSARFGTFPMAFCTFEVDDTFCVQSLWVHNSRWDLTPVLPVFRTLTIEPDCDPARGMPKILRLRFQQRQKSLALDRPVELIQYLNHVLTEFDPDILLTQWGDNWVLPTLLKLSAESGQELRLNRDRQREVHWQKELTYFSYGQIIYRAEEAHLFGRCHIDQRNAMMWRDYGLDGVLESARVTAQSIERAARVSPGSGISAMQMLTALEHQILVPWHKQQVEQFKSGMDLIQRDRGGLIYQPIVGVHTNVGQIDFVSMYPAIIIKGNISPEVPLPNGIIPASDELGVVPLTLKPLYDKRVALKMNQAGLNKDDPLVKRDKARASALKWLLVVCFGFLGYKNARFGRIEAHEAVTNGGREVLLLAKDVAEAMGFEVLHLFVDALWLKKPGAVNKKDFSAVLDAISDATGLGITLDGVYRWVAFLPSRADSRVPVANRYFGVFQDGTLKVRGIEARRRDTPPWVSETQTKMLNTLARAYVPEMLNEKVAEAFSVFRQALQNLREDKVPVEKLVITSRITHEIENYKSPTPAVRAARQLLQKTGKRVRPGQKMRFVFTRGDADVFPWEMEGDLDASQLDKDKYIELLARAASSVLYPFGVELDELKQWAHSATIELPLKFERQVPHVRPVLNHVRPRRDEGFVGFGGSAG